MAADLAAPPFDGPDYASQAQRHGRNQGLDRQAVELCRDLEGTTVTEVGDLCSGISGTDGWKAEHAETSMAVGAEMFEEWPRRRARPGSRSVSLPRCRSPRGRAARSSTPWALGSTRSWEHGRDWEDAGDSAVAKQ